MDEQPGVTQFLQGLYKDLEAAVEEGLKKSDLKVSCSKGCAHCCYLLTSVVFAEALLMAETVLKMENWEEWVQKLREAAKAHDYIGINKSNFFDKGIACPFLKDNLCAVYEVRPSCCRFHAVISPPENCSRFSIDTNTKIVNLMKAEERVWEFSYRVTEETGWKDLLVGPLPIMVLSAMRVLLEGNPEHNVVVAACEGIRPPILWLKECAFDGFKKEVEELKRVGLAP